MKRILFDTFRLTFYGFGLGIGMSGSFYLLGLNKNKEDINNSIKKDKSSENINQIEITSDIYN